MTRLVITDKHQTFSFNDSSGVERNEISQKAMGGTELMANRLLSSMSPEQKDKFQIICSRYRGIQQGKMPIFWAHDMSDDPEAQFLSDINARRMFGKLVFVSNWQQHDYIRKFDIKPSECLTIKNGITPFSYEEIKRNKSASGPIRLIYHSTPHRGLNILVAAFETLCKEFDIVLDVYSSFKLYGWEENDIHFEKILTKCKNHPKINYHGSVPNDEIRAALLKADIFAYPSIWPETSCLCAIEAGAAGCRIVVPNYSALVETCAAYSWMYQYHEDITTHAQLFTNILGHAIATVRNDTSFEACLNQAAYFNSHYNWDIIKNDWQALFTGLERANPEYWRKN